MYLLVPQIILSFPSTMYRLQNFEAGRLKSLSSHTAADKEDVIFSVCMPGMNEDECIVKDEPAVTAITSVNQFLSAVQNRGHISVVYYSSKKYKMCRLADVKFQNLARRYEDKREKIQFFTIEQSSNPLLSERAIRFPLVEIYDCNSELATSLTFNRIYEFNVFIRKEVDRLLVTEVDKEERVSKFETNEKTSAFDWLEKLREIDRARKFGQ